MPKAKPTNIPRLRYLNAKLRTLFSGKEVLRIPITVKKYIIMLKF